MIPRKLRAAAGVALLVVCLTMAFAEEFESATEFAALDNLNSGDGQAWYLLARSAREAGDTEIAMDALARAEALEFAPVRIGFERARIAVMTDRPSDAENELQKIADTGFTSVQFFTNDPIINSLAGREKYDAFVQAMSVQAYPCEHQERFRDFDFWLGEWVVQVAGGQQVGTNSITSIERGCMIREEWTNASGSTGTSINYFDSVGGEWVQIWHDASGSQINVRGGLTDDGMLLVGYIHDVNSGTTKPFRGLWTPLDDGRVRQFFEHSDDDGETWTSWFEGFYTRTDEAK